MKWNINKRPDAIGLLASLIGITALVAVISLGLAGCPTSGGGDGKEVESLAVDSNSVKKDYWVGDKLNTSGLVVIATYTDGSEGAFTGYTLELQGGIPIKNGDTLVNPSSDKTTGDQISVKSGKVAASETFSITVKAAPSISPNIEKIDIPLISGYYQVKVTLDLSQQLSDLGISDAASQILGTVDIDTAKSWLKLTGTGDFTNVSSWNPEIDMTSQGVILTSGNIGANRTGKITVAINPSKLQEIESYITKPATWPKDKDQYIGLQAGEEKSVEYK